MSDTGRRDVSRTDVRAIAGVEGGAATTREEVMLMAILDRLPKLAGSPRSDEQARAPAPAPAREGFATPVGAFVPALDLEESGDQYTLHVELPGVRPEDIELSVDGEALTLTGERHFYDEQEAERFRRVERSFGRFHRVIRLPDGSDPEGVEATWRDGLLEIRVPKRERARARRIEVHQAA